MLETAGARASLVLLLGGLIACSDGQTAGVDARVLDPTGNPRDQMVRDGGRDLAAADGPATDGRAADAAGCADDLDLSPFTLDPGYCVVRRFDVDGLPYAFNFAGDEVWTFHPSTANPVDWPVRHWVYDPLEGTLGPPNTVFTFTPTIAAPADKAFGNEYVALSAGGRVAAGYTVNKVFSGEVFWGDGAPPAVIEQANGNYDVLFWDEQTLLINAAGGVGAVQQGQAVYLFRPGQAPRRLIGALGSLSGHLALGDGVLFAGGFFGTENRIYAFTRAEVAAAISGGRMLDPEADGDLVYTGYLLDAAAWGDELVVARMSAELEFEAISGIPVTFDDDAISAEPSHDIITPGGSLAFGRLAARGGQLAMLAREGLQRSEISVVRAR